MSPLVGPVGTAVTLLYKFRGNAAGWAGCQEATATEHASLFHTTLTSQLWAPLRCHDHMFLCGRTSTAPPLPLFSLLSHCGDCWPVRWVYLCCVIRFLSISGKFQRKKMSPTPQAVTATWMDGELGLLFIDFFNRGHIWIWSSRPSGHQNLFDCYVFKQVDKNFRVTTFKGTFLRL